MQLSIQRVFYIVVILVSLPLVTFSKDAEPIMEVEKLPLWEYGVVGVAANIPHYRGSDEYTLYAFPLPYFIYRGKVLKTSRDGVRGIFWRNKRFETDISMSGNPPVSDDNEARQGMPELDAIFEIGPALRYYLYEAGERDSFFIQANVRAAFSIDFSDGIDSDYEGYVSDLSLVYRDSKTFREVNIRYNLSGGIQFADSDMHSYFYEVTPQYATNDLPLYNASGGYGGLQLSASLSKELNDSFTIGCYGKWVNIGGAIYEDSPLVKTNNSYVIGAMITWKIGESETLEKSNRTLIKRKND